MRLVWVLLLLVGCRSAATSVVPQVAPVGGVPERFLPAFEALGAAVEAHEDVVARAILGGLLARLGDEREQGGPEETAGMERARAIAHGYERVLVGRALVAGLDFELGTTDVPGTTSVRVFLRASSRHAVEALLLPGPATLRMHQISLAPGGAEMHSVWATHVGGLEKIHVPAQGSIVIPLGSYPLLVPRDSLAVRMRWELAIRSGEIRAGEEPYPAAGITVRPVVAERLAAVLPVAPVEPSELLRYASGSTPWQPALLERTVRIAPERRAEALDLLAPLVAASTETQLERLAPVLRWLTDEPDPESGPLGWKEAMLERAKAAPSAAEPASGLDIR
jgi:hypothetical protein